MSAEAPQAPRWTQPVQLQNGPLTFSVQLDKATSTDDPSQSNGGECIKGCMCALGCVGSSLVGDRNLERKHLGGIIVKLTETVCVVFLGHRAMALV
jgi:hypothetical protein